MVFRMHFMVQAGVVGLVVIDVIKLIHDKTFPLRLTEQAFDVIFFRETSLTVDLSPHRLAVVFYTLIGHHLLRIFARSLFSNTVPL